MKKIIVLLLCLPLLLCACAGPKTLQSHLTELDIDPAALQYAISCVAQDGSVQILPLSEEAKDSLLHTMQTAILMKEEPVTSEGGAHHRITTDAFTLWIHQDGNHLTLIRDAEQKGGTVRVQAHFETQEAYPVALLPKAEETKTEPALETLADKIAKADDTLLAIDGTQLEFEAAAFPEGSLRFAVLEDDNLTLGICKMTSSGVYRPMKVESLSQVEDKLIVRAVGSDEEGSAITLPAPTGIKEIWIVEMGAITDILPMP